MKDECEKEEKRERKPMKVRSKVGLRKMQKHERRSMRDMGK